MLSKKTITAISSLLKINEADVEAAIASETETDLVLPEVKVFTTPELDTRDKAIKNGAYNDGKDASAEILIKELKSELGLTFEGKDKATLVAEVKKMQANPTGVDVEALRNSVKTAEEKAAAALSDLKQHKIRGKAAAHLPSNLAVDMSQDELLTILSANGFAFDEDDNGNLKITRNGQELKDDKLQTALPAATVLTSFFKDEKKWLKEEDPKQPGRGGNSSQPIPNVFTKFSQVQKKWEEEGKNTNSAEFSAHVNKIAKDTPGFDMEA